VGIMLLVATLLMAVFMVGVLYLWQSKEIAIIQQTVPVEKAAQAIEQLHSSIFNWTIVGGIGVLFLRALVCAALTMMISAFATSWLFTVVASFMAILIGHLVPIARSVWLEPAQFGIEVSWYLNLFLRIVILFPDMQLFNVTDAIAAGQTVHWWAFASAGGMGLGYLAIYMLVAWLFFAWKEL